VADEKKPNEPLVRKVLGKRAEQLSSQDLALLDGFSDFMVEMFIDYMQKRKESLQPANQ
jgi:hypothetical protein